MPKVSKVRIGGNRTPPSTRSPEASPAVKEQKDTRCQCTRCGRTFKQRRGNFPGSQSPLYFGNEKCLPICGNCLDELFDHYLNVLGDEDAAMKRICMKFDIYWNVEAYDHVRHISSRHSRVRSYIGQMNLVKNSGKTFDDTLDEEKQETDDWMTRKEEEIREKVFADLEEERANLQKEKEYVEAAPDEATLEFWGAGLPYEIYPALNARYRKWTADIDGEIDKALEARYKQICILEETVNSNIASGKFPESSIKTLNDLIKEVQKTQTDSGDEAFDALPFGVGIKMCENTRPIPKPIPELEDHDGIVRYISIWFLGHLCKMLGIKNTYCKLYEDEMARLRVERPDLDEEDDEGAFNEIFGESDEL